MIRIFCVPTKHNRALIRTAEIRNFVMWVSNCRVGVHQDNFGVTSGYAILICSDVRVVGTSAHARAPRNSSSYASPCFCLLKRTGFAKYKKIFQCGRYQNTRGCQDRRKQPPSQHKSKLVTAPLKVSISRYWLLSCQHSNIFHATIIFLSVRYTTIENNGIVRNIILGNVTRALFISC